MKKLLVFFVLWFAFSGCKKEIEGMGVKLTLEQRSLANGLTVIMVEDHAVPIISYQTWYRVGSVDEKPGMTGISHLFEHMMFKGTPKYGPRQFFLQLEAKGADVNAFTTRDYTTYYETFVPPLLEKVVDMESDRMANLIIDDAIFNNERLVVLEERRLRSENAPEGKIQEALWALSYRFHPYQWPVIGYTEDLLNLKTAQVKDYFKTHYNPSNAAVVVIGDFNTERLWPLIKKYYSPLSGSPRPIRNIPKEPEQNEERRLTLRDQVTAERLSLAYHVTSASDEDSFALDVLTNILLEGSTSRAYHKLVEEKDLALGVNGSAYTPTYPGLFTVNITLKSGVPASAAEAVLDEVIRDIQKKGVTDEEIRIAVRQLTVQLLDGIRTPYGLGQLIGTVQMILGDPERFGSDLQKYFRVTEKDIKRVAQRYLNPNNRSVVIMTPEVEK